MRLPLKDFFASICQDVAKGARAGTEEAVKFAKNAEDLSVDIPIADQTLRVEGAANMPSRIILAKSFKLKTQGFLTLDDNDEPSIHLKKGLFKQAPEIEIEIEFERTEPLESLEMARDRANEVNREYIQIHKAQMAIAKQKAIEEIRAKSETKAKTKRTFKSKTGAK